MINNSPSITLLEIIGILCLIFFWIDVYVIAGFWKKRAMLVNVIIAFITGSYEYYMVQNVCYFIRYLLYEGFNINGRRNYIKPASFYIISLAIVAIINIYLISVVLISRKKSVALFSIKEAIDNLPAAICFYDSEGRVFLKNRIMDEMSVMLTGEVLLNGKSFERMLDDKQHHVSNKIMYIGDSTIIRYHSKYYIIEKRNFDYTSGVVTELKAIDITEEYKESRILEEKQSEARELSLKVRKYRDNIRDMTIAEETLRAKIRIHDELGEELLSLKKYLILGGNDEELIRLYRLLRCNVGILNDERDLEVKNPYDKVLNTASNVGVGIEISGELPKEKPLVEIVAKALHESVTNTLRHAKGDRVFIDVVSEEDKYIITIKNNGIQPNREIEETGGLLQLRKSVESIKGRMQVSSIPEMKIMIEIGKENARYGI